MSLGEFFPVGSVDHRHVTKNWGHSTERPIDRELFGGVGNVIVAADHVRDVHVDVVDDDGKITKSRISSPLKLMRPCTASSHDSSPGGTRSRIASSSI